jgi:hypothetical protein
MLKHINQSRYGKLEVIHKNGQPLKKPLAEITDTTFIGFMRC